ncbi:MAG: outer membrane lipoprotein-sorting protein [Fimbriimonadaceae bacterium]|nr:outer membrane lipoprotein-sorting protein [Fimbriimonadaceae bacterium]
MLTLSALAAMSLVVSPQSQDIKNYVQSSFEDASFTVVTGQYSMSELSKISKDFSQSYRFKQSQVWLKEPFKLRMMSEVDDTQVLFVVNGGKRMYKFPRSGVMKTDDISKAPGKRQTALDFGILTPALVNSYFSADFVRIDRATGDAVFDLTYVPNLKDSSRHRVWIDPSTKVVTKREWYAQKRNDGRLMATFIYSSPKKFGNITLATALTVNNSDNKRAGSLTYNNIKVNTGLSDSLFALK